MASLLASRRVDRLRHASAWAWWATNEHPLLVLLGVWAAGRAVASVGQWVMRLWRGTDQAQASAAQVLSLMIGKPAEQYEFGDLTLSVLRNLKSAFARHHHQKTSRRRKKQPPLAPEAGLDHVLGSFCEQVAVLAKRFVERGVISQALVDSRPPNLASGLTAATALYSVLRSLDDTKHCEDQGVLLATGAQLTAKSVGETPELGKLLQTLLGIKQRLKDLGPTKAEREDLARLCLTLRSDASVARQFRRHSLVQRQPSDVAPATTQETQEERALQMRHLAEELLALADFLRAALSEEVFDQNMEDVLAVVSEESFGSFGSGGDSSNELFSEVAHDLFSAAKKQDPAQPLHEEAEEEEADAGEAAEYPSDAFRACAEAAAAAIPHLDRAPPQHERSHPSPLARGSSSPRTPHNSLVEQDDEAPDPADDQPRPAPSVLPKQGRSTRVRSIFDVDDHSR